MFQFILVAKCSIFDGGSVDEYVLGEHSMLMRRHRLCAFSGLKCSCAARVTDRQVKATTHNCIEKSGNTLRISIAQHITHPSMMCE